MTINHNAQLKILQKKCAVFLLQSVEKKPALIEKTIEYFKMEIDGGCVDPVDWERLGWDLADDVALDVAEYLDLDLNLTMALAKGGADLDLARTLDLARARARALDLALDLDLDRALAKYLLSELGDFVPTIAHIEARILADLEAGWGLNMDDYHTCATTHCVLGYAQLYAGDVGKTLKQYFGDWLSGAVIWLKATGSIPDAYASEENALASLKAGAALNK